MLLRRQPLDKRMTRADYNLLRKQGAPRQSLRPLVLMSRLCCLAEVHVWSRLQRCASRWTMQKRLDLESWKMAARRLELQSQKKQLFQRPVPVSTTEEAGNGRRLDPQQRRTGRGWRRAEALIAWQEGRRRSRPRLKMRRQDSAGAANGGD